MSQSDKLLRGDGYPLATDFTAMTTDPSDIVERLREVGCDREPFTPDHVKCICRLTNDAADEIERKTTSDIMGLHGPKPEAVERAAKSIAIAFGRDVSRWREFILHAQAALIGALDPDNRFSK